jgi:hypothetical protein
MIDGEEFATVCHQGHQDGPLIIDVMMNTLDLVDAKRLSTWLLYAIEEVKASRKRSPERIVK